MKIEETVRRLHEIYSTALTTCSLHGISPPSSLSDHELDAKEMKHVRDIVMDFERILLQDIQFDVEIHSPHRFGLSLLKLLGFDGEGGAGEIVARFNFFYNF